MDMHKKLDSLNRTPVLAMELQQHWMEIRWSFQNWRLGLGSLGVLRTFQRVGIKNKSENQDYNNNFKNAMAN
jgi:hypothetical protein